MKYKIICHRGINRIQENTYKSITDTTKLQLTDNIIFGVEFDVQITKDNSLICYHDETLTRLHKSDKKVSDLTLSDITKYDLPYFSTVMSALSTNNNLIIDVELKTYQPMDLDKVKLLCKSVVDICNSFDVINQCVFTSFDDAVVRELVNINKYMKIGKIMNKTDKVEDFEQLKNIGVSTLIMHKDMILDALDNHSLLLSDVDLYVYTLYNINNTNNTNNSIDDEIIKIIKEKDVGLITDNYTKILKLIQ